MVTFLPVEAISPKTQTEDIKATIRGNMTPRILRKQKKRIKSIIMIAIILKLMVPRELSAISALINGIPE
ncbi:hypothetical protein ES708_18099 [subsurface metagenome]